MVVVRMKNLAMLNIRSDVPLTNPPNSTKDICANLLFQFYEDNAGESHAPVLNLKHCYGF